MSLLSSTEQQVIAATQAGLPLVDEPYRAIADALGLTQHQVLDILADLQRRGIIRRIAIAPNHYALGVTANGMSVWDVTEEQAAILGAQVGALDFVSHCYLRPRALPDWPYNLFAMLHGETRDQVEQKRHLIRQILGDACQGDDILYSTRILKKTGMRIRDERKETPCSA